MAAGALIAMPLTGQVLAGRSSARRDPRRHARLLPDAAAAADRAQPGRARRDPVRLRRRQRRDGCLDERARRRGRARPRHARSCPRCTAAGASAASSPPGSRRWPGAAGADPRRAGAVRSASRCGWRRGGSPRGSARPRRTRRRGQRLRAARPRRDPDRRRCASWSMVTEGAIGDWSGIYLRQDLGSSAGRRGHGLHRLLARDGGRPARRRLAQRAPRRRAAAARRDVARRARARRRCC